MSARTHHVALTVSSIKDASAWLAAAFGFEEELSFDVPDGRGAMLRNAAEDRIELFECQAARAGKQRLDPGAMMLTCGYGHLGLEVDDIDAAYERALTAGGLRVWDPRPSPEPGRRMAFVHDPDGNLVELIGPIETPETQRAATDVERSA